LRFNTSGATDVEDEMTETDPIACSLDGGEFEARIATVAEVGRRALISRGRDCHRHLLRFRSTPDTRARLEEIVEAERRCCPFLNFEMDQEDGEILLTIAAPPGGESTAAGLAAAFAEEPEGGPLPPAAAD
jgi:hypothetical protein